MCNFKIIETGSKFPNVLLYRDRNEDGQESVNILAIGIVDQTENMFACEEVVFENHISASNFIKDYSKNTAEKWCERMDVSYWNV